MAVTKAVIPCGGQGTRFLPITKAVPKEILPIIDIPSLGYIIDEAASSGITDVMLVLAPNKEAIKEYFAPNPQLEDSLEKAGRGDLTALLKGISNKVNIVYGYQMQPKGSGDAVLQAEKFTGKDPFCLAWGDDVIAAGVPVTGQLIDAFEKVKTHIVGVQYWAGDDITKYGVAKLNSQAAAGYDNAVDVAGAFNMATGAGRERLFRTAGFLEKPPLELLPSRYAALGRYLLTAEIYDEIRLTPAGKNGELQLTDAINSLCVKSKVYGYDFEGRRYDCGDKLGFIKAVVEFGLKREFGEELRAYLKNLVTDVG